jgi:DNA-binding response OmpR family regulator
VLARVRQSVRTAGLPVLVLTGSIGEDTEAQLMDEGADDYIRKPLEPARFVARVRAALRRASS